MRADAQAACSKPSTAREKGVADPKRKPGRGCLQYMQRIWRCANPNGRRTAMECSPAREETHRHPPPVHHHMCALLDNQYIHNHLCCFLSPYLTRVYFTALPAYTRRVEHRTRRDQLEDPVPPRTRRANTQHGAAPHALRIFARRLERGLSFRTRL